MTRPESPAEYRQRTRGYDPWIDPPTLAARCVVCDVANWRYGCPSCGRRTIPDQEGAPPVTAYRDRLNAGHYAPPTPNPAKPKASKKTQPPKTVKAPARG